MYMADVCACYPPFFLASMVDIDVLCMEEVLILPLQSLRGKMTVELYRLLFALFRASGKYEFGVYVVDNKIGVVSLSPGGRHETARLR